MDIKFMDVTADNFKECIKLTVSEDQKGYVASNVFSVAQSKVSPELIPTCIYAGDVMVGFTMFGRDVDDGNIWIARLMIDEKYQGKGYGKAAVAKLIEFLPEKYGCSEVYLSTEPHNTHAQRIYESLGFINTGEIICDEAVFIKKIG